MYSSSPSLANSIPDHERFQPPKGALGWIIPWLLIWTLPHSIQVAISFAAALSAGQTEPPSPMSPVIGEAQPFLNRRHLDDRQDRAELLFLHQRIAVR